MLQADEEPSTAKQQNQQQRTSATESTRSHSATSESYSYQQHTASSHQQHARNYKTVQLDNIPLPSTGGTVSGTSTLKTISSTPPPHSHNPHYKTNARCTSCIFINLIAKNHPPTDLFPFLKITSEYKKNPTKIPHFKNNQIKRDRKQ